MKLRYSVTMDDLIFFNLYTIEHSDMAKKTIFQIQLWMGIILLLMVSLVSYYSKLWYVVFLIGIVFSTYFILTFKKVYKKSLEKQIRKVLSASADSDKEMLDIQTLELGDDGIYAKGELSEGKTTWPAVVKIAKTNNYTLIYIASTKAYIIRHDSITEGDLKTFLNKLETKLTLKQ